MIKTRILLVLIITALTLLLLNTKAFAASASLSVSSSEVTKGDTFTVTVTATSMAAWDIHVSADGPVSGDGINDADATSDGKNTTKTFSTTYTATDAGTIKIKLTGDVTGEDDDNATDIGTSKTVTVTAPSTLEPTVEPEPTTPKPTAEPEPTTPEPTAEPEPTTPEPTTPEPTTPEPNVEPTTPEPTKSSNANLGNLGIKPNDFTGFRMGVTSYNVSVPYEVDEIEVYANKLENSQTIVGTGIKRLSEGSNVFDVTVTAEDGTKKTYSITVVRLAKEKVDAPNINNPETKIEVALASIQILNVTLNEPFNPNVYEYTATADKDAKEVIVNGSANIQNAIVDIDSPTEFKDGENIITITVKEKDGDGKKVYTIKVEKKTEDENDSKANTVVPATIGSIDNNNKKGRSGISKETLIFCAGVAVVTLLGIIFATIRYNKDKAMEAEVGDLDFVGDISAKEAIIDAAVATSKLSNAYAEPAEESFTSTSKKGKHF